MSTLLLTACPDSNKTNAQQKPAAPATVKPAPAKPAPDDASAKPADKDAVIITSIIKDSEAYYKELCKDASVSKEERRSKLILHIA